MPNDTPALLSADEAAHMLGCGRTYVYQLMQEGRLMSIKLGRLRRIPREEIDAFIARELARERDADADAP